MAGDPLQVRQFRYTADNLARIYAGHDYVAYSMKVAKLIDPLNS